MYVYYHNIKGNNNKDEDNSPKTLNGKNHQASSQKFRQLKKLQYIIVYASIKLMLLLLEDFLKYAKSTFYKFYIQGANAKLGIF